MLSVYRLAGPLAGEKVISVIHRDAFIAVKRVVFFVLLLALPIIVLIMINILFPVLSEQEWIWPAVVIAASAYVFFIWLLFFFSLIDYFLDVWIITDQRIIDIRQKGFFSRSISEVRLNRIQDVSSESAGFLPTVLHFGNVIVQTASENSKLFFEEVANPEHIRDMLMRLTHERKDTEQHSA